MSPLKKPWFINSKLSVLTVTAVLPKPIGLIESLSFAELYLTTTAVDSPIPTERLGFTVS